ncbi:MAG: T9SS type A sorting domain-containing protein [Bacteroidetes bacterium]|nr:T9SS type A sorting domain-containing protein [Bacteroidota bacterium]
MKRKKIIPVREFLLKYICTFFLCALTSAGYSQNYALSFNGVDDYISFGNDSNLRLEAYTLECWFMVTGQGIPTGTGTGGAYAVPLITKGRGESDTDNRDLNYFLGIDSTTNLLVSDIEEGFLQWSPGLNHPQYGITPIVDSVWYHVALTFDSNQMTLYLNGQLEFNVGIGVKTQAQSIQHASIASAIRSYGLAHGFFHGLIDEVRIWNYARNIIEIQSNINTVISSPHPGLAGCWSFNEGTGSAVADSSGNNVNGLLYGTGYSWEPGAPLNMDINVVPDFPTVITPLNGDTCVPVNNVILNVLSNDSGNDTLVVRYYGRPAFNSPPNFTIVPIPDTQHYTAEIKGGTIEGLKVQTNWIAANTALKNICFATQLGDCTENGQNGGNDIEWRRADTAFSYLENPITTGLPEGIPYSICVGNHDQTGMGNPNGNTTFFNQFFGYARFGSRSYYGGYYGLNYDNHFTLFSASGYDFIEINLEYDQVANPLVLNWADSILKAYPSRRAIVTSHHFLNPDNTFGPQGQATFDHLNNNPNLFLMLCGHMPGEGKRTDTINGNIIHTILSDYQSRPTGGSGWIKVLEFKPAINKIAVETYSPLLDMFETDGDSKYNLDYNMTPEYQLLDSIVVAPGADASYLWSGLQMASAYEWYAVVSDGKYEQMTELIRFSTNNNEHISLGSDTTQCGGTISIGTTDTNYTYVWSTGSTTQFVTVNQTGNYTITATSIAGNCSVKDEIVVTINSIPNAYLGNDTTVCGHIILDGETGSAFNYTWQDGTTLPAYTAINSGTYSLFIQDSITGCYNSDTISVVVNPLPVVSLGSDSTQCGGSILIGNIAGTYQYLWSTGDTTNYISVDNSGQYILNAVDPVSGCEYADTIQITINAIPFLDLGSDTIVCAKLTIDAPYNSNYLHSWSNGATDSAITVLQSGSYWLFLQESTFGCFISDTITVVVNPVPVVNLGNDIVQCGGSVTLGITDLTNNYLWSTGDTNAYVTTNTSGSYILNATNILTGCFNADTIDVIINEIPVNNLGPDTAACGEIILSGSAGVNYLYNWSNGSTMQSIITSLSGIYTLLIIDSITGCQNYDTIQTTNHAFPVIDLGQDIVYCGSEVTIGTSDMSNTYVWSTGASSSEIVVYQSGNYIITATSNIGSCVSRDTINVIINQLPVSVLTNDTSSCFPINLNAFIGINYLYTWQNGLTNSELFIEESGQYVVSIEDVNTGCAITDTVNAVINPKPVVELGNDINCSPCNFTISAAAGFTNYLWNTGATSASIGITTPGLYIVVVTDQNGCNARDSIMITTATEIYPNPITDHLVINFGDQSVILKVEIYDELGKAISYDYEVADNDWIISTSHFAKGVYFVNVSATGFEKFYRVIKI